MFLNQCLEGIKYHKMEFTIISLVSNMKPKIATRKIWKGGAKTECLCGGVATN